MSTLKRFWKSLVWAIIILLLSTMSVKSIDSDSIFRHIPHFDKLVHFGLYFIWTSLILAEWHRHQNPIHLKHIILIWIIVSTYGVLMEWLQSIGTANRQADVLDALCNSLGAIISILIYQNTRWFPKFLSFILRD